MFEQGYFWKMNEYFHQITNPDYHSYIMYIAIENTASVCEEFSNLRIKTGFGNKELRRYRGKSLIDELSNDEIHNYVELEKKVENMRLSRPDIKFKINSWVSMTELGYMLYEDVCSVVKKYELNDIDVYINICGYDNKLKSMEVAIQKDIEYLFKHPLLNKRIRRIHDNMEYIMKGMNTQKNAYLLSKLITNRAFRKDYERNEELIKAYDAYLDVRKAIDKTPYC